MSQSLFIQPRSAPSNGLKAIIHSRTGGRVVQNIPKPSSRTKTNRQSPLLSRLKNGSSDPLAWLIREIREQTGFSHGLVGELCGADWNQVQTLIVDTIQGPADNFRYDLQGTPCQEVLNCSPVVFMDNVWQAFPEDVLLEQMGIESYVGIPVYDDVGRPLGIIVLLGHAPISLKESMRALQLLYLAADTVKGRLESNRRHRDVESILESVVALDATTSKRAVLACMARTLMLRGAFLSVPDNQDGTIQTIVCAQDDYPITGTLTLDNEVWNQAHCSRTPFLTELAPDQCPTSTENGSSHTCATQMRHAVMVPLVDEDGEVLAMAGVFHDRALNPRILEMPLLHFIGDKLSMLVREEQALTARTTAEARLQKLQQLESLGVLAAGIAHDFNNILVGVLGNADYLKDTLPSTLDPESLESVNDINEAALSANNLCKQLMLYAGRSRLEADIFDLNATLEDLARLSAATLGVPCTFHPRTNSTAISISGDATQIRQVIMNLLTNARDAVGTDGLVTLSLSTITVSATGLSTFSGQVPAGDYAIVSVKDNGCGIEATQLERIFEPFFTTKGTGHGLGLAGVLGLIRTHDGWLDVHSEVNHGTEFTVYLPRATGVTVHEDPTVPVPPSPLAVVNPTLLIVDDDARVRRLLTKFSAKAGYDVLLAEDGAEAVRIYKKHEDRISAVVLDLNMPVCSGEECYRILREHNPSLKILLSSGNLEIPLEAPSLPKPYSLQAFIRSVEVLLSE